MSDLRCTKCDETASFADAYIADLYRTCGDDADDKPHLIEASDGSMYEAWSGEKHNWVRMGVSR